MYNSLNTMKIMEKKNYIAPEIRNVVCESEEMIAASQYQLNKDADSQNIKITDEEANEFTSRRFSSWDDEE